MKLFVIAILAYFSLASDLDSAIEDDYLPTFSNVNILNTQPGLTPIANTDQTDAQGPLSTQLSQIKMDPLKLNVKDSIPELT